MSGHETAIRQLLEAWDGQVTPPTSLEALVGTVSISDSSGWLARVQDALITDFGDVQSAIVGLASAGDTDIRALARRLGWTVTALADWDATAANPQERIEIALASAAAWDQSGAFWRAIRPRLDRHPKLRVACELVVNGRATEVQYPNGTPIWEREHYGALLDAEQRHDWFEVAGRAASFERLPFLDPAAREAILALFHLDQPRLVRMSERVGSWVRAHVIQEPLMLADALRLAAASRNEYLRFAALDRIANRERRTLSAAEVRALRNLLLILARDGTDWAAWLAVCNRYPARHSHIQTALAAALARSDDAALRVYTESIELTTADPDGRTIVAACLAEFRSLASPNRRRRLWRDAHDRWQSWNFGESEDRTLTAITQSALDYAVVGWLVEGERPEDPDAKFACELTAHDSTWHVSASAARSHFFRMLSRHHLIKHALGRSANAPDWLPDLTPNLPAAADAFVQRRYGA